MLNNLQSGELSARQSPLKVYSNKKNNKVSSLKYPISNVFITQEKKFIIKVKLILILEDYTVIHFLVRNVYFKKF